MKKLLLTGAGGFTARFLAPRLQSSGYEIIGVDHAPPAQPADGCARFEVLDLRDYDRVSNLIGEIRPDKVVHLAAISFVAHQNVEEMYATNIVGTRHLLEALSRVSNLPDTILLASSATVYGNAAGELLDESMPLAPAHDYGITKAAMELIGRRHGTRLPIIITRPFNYTGKGQSPNFLIPKIVRHFASRSPVLELGNLDVARDFSDVRSVIDCYARLLEEPAAVGGVFNICSGKAVTTRAIIELAQRITGHEICVQTNPAYVRPGEVTSMRGSADRLRAIIGETAHIPLEGTMRWMLEDR